MNNNENNYIKEKIELLKPQLRQNTLQLNDIKKQNNGFDLAESVIDVEQCGYGVSNEDDILFTYGIEPCCGLVLYDENVRVLFHLDGSVTPEDVIEVTNSIGLQQDATAIFAPGTTCRTQGCFEYRQLEEEYRKLGYTVLEQRIPATFGFVTVCKNQITIGTALDRDLDKTFPIERKRTKVETQKLGKEVLSELGKFSFLKSIQAKMLEQNKRNSTNKERD